MNRTERLYRIDQLLASRRVVNKQTLLDDLEVSWSTLKRDIAYMREHLNAPIAFDSDLGLSFFSANNGSQVRVAGLMVQSR